MAAGQPFEVQSPRLSMLRLSSFTILSFIACSRTWIPALTWKPMRNDRCPICGAESAEVLQLHFNTKMSLPTEISIRHCASDNFLFVANGDQESYDAYYKSLANDSYHAE